MLDIDPDVIEELATRERWIVRERILTGLGLVTVGTGTMVAGLAVAVAVGGLDAMSILVGTALVSGWCLSTGRRILDQLVRIPIARVDRPLP